MKKICFVAPELSPFSTGGIGVLLHNLLVEYQDEDVEFHVLALRDSSIDNNVFKHIFPKTILWRSVDLVQTTTDPALNPPDWAFTTHPWHYKSYQAAQALKAIAALGNAFDVIEFPDWGGLAFCAIQEKLLGNLGGALLAVRLHSTDSILRAGQPVIGGHAAANLADLERKSLLDADLVVAHLASIARATQQHFGFSTKWLSAVRIDAPPIPMKSATKSIRFETTTDICFPSKIQALKRPDVFLNGALAFMRSHVEYTGNILFLAHPSDEDLRQQLSDKIPVKFAERVTFLFDAPSSVRASIIERSISIFPSPFESFCLAAYEASMHGGWVALNKENPAFSDATIWEDGTNCLKFDGTSLGLAECLELAWSQRAELQLRSVSHSAAKQPYWMKLPNRKAKVSSEVKTQRTPLVSVVVPYFNMGRYIHRTLESALASTYANMEIVLVDDCSTDQHSQMVLDKIRQADQFDCVRVVSAPTNVGLSGARNLGIRQARGEFILTLDSDDLIRSDFIETAVGALLKNPDYSLVVPQTAFVTEESSNSEMTVIDYALFIGEAIRGGTMANRYSTATSLGRRELYAEFPYDEYLSSYEDWDFYARAVRAGKRFIVASDIYFYYRRRAGSMIAENTRHRHIRNLSIIRSKQLLTAGHAAIDLNIMTDSEASYNTELDRLSGIGTMRVDGNSDQKDQYIRMLRGQIAHQDILLKDANTKLSSIQETVEAWRSAGAANKGNARSEATKINRKKRSLSWPLGGWYSNAKIRKSIRELMRSGEFDAKWYLANNPDVAAAGMDAALHYLKYGRNEGRLGRPGD
ncbi:glycosyltransferase [Rhizobium sp. P38BS-XIX]|uniref:glycosyltransferase n=1 Tax=Rhizobium sp. P38BS-XIX TaxID=2726740 RepID=UPI00145747A0|nr:glycosyltransferase [Rhizobium sp. P38BS-XIX]NLS00664.1 glycosyltransferase [Rhizobium sp. P38BS-XIX]